MPDERCPSVCPKCGERMFPLQADSRGSPVMPGPVRIPWSIAEMAYGSYVREYGRGQSLEQIAERGGFGWSEMDRLYPAWREKVSDFAYLRADLARVTAERDAARADVERQRAEVEGWRRLTESKYELRIERRTDGKYEAWDGCEYRGLHDSPLAALAAIEAAEQGDAG